MMEDSGVLKVVVIVGDVVMVPAHMFGIIHKLLRIYFLHWKEVFVILSFVKAKMKRAIRILEQHFRLNQLRIVFIRLGF